MSKSQTEVQERIATAPSRGPQPPTYQFLGVDSAGYSHVLDRDSETVTRFDGCVVENVENLGRADHQLDEVLSAYWEHVADGVGWARINFVPILGVF